MVRLPVLAYCHYRGKLSNTALVSLPSVADCKEQGQVSCSHTLRSRSPEPTPSRPALLFCPDEMQSPISGLLPLERGSALPISSPGGQISRLLKVITGGKRAYFPLLSLANRFSSNTLCCPGEGPGPLSGVLHPVRAGLVLTFLAAVPDLSSAAGGKVLEEEEQFLLSCATTG